MKAVIDKKLRDYMENKKLKNIVFIQRKRYPPEALLRGYISKVC